MGGLAAATGRSTRVLSTPWDGAHRRGATNPRQGAYNPARPSGFPDLSRERPMAYNLLRQDWLRTRPFGWGASPGAPIR
ncbi:hypothetical protein GCM10008164_29340 [Achromobacter xylosoxidans]|nr:hypothetical protein GCM10008164_29340 [Achromobacter xylosoxidans]